MKKTDKTIYIDGGFNFSYCEMLYGQYGIRNKAMYCKKCKNHFKYCDCKNKNK